MNLPLAFVSHFIYTWKISLTFSPFSCLPRPSHRPLSKTKLLRVQKHLKPGGDHHKWTPSCLHSLGSATLAKRSPRDTIRGTRGHPAPPCALRIVTGDERNLVDYVFASVDPMLPRILPPILWKLYGALWFPRASKLNGRWEKALIAPPHPLPDIFIHAR
jgi:hypothetical protein